MAGRDSSWGWQVATVAGDGRSRQQLGMAGHGSSWGCQVMAVAGDGRSRQ